MSPNRLATIRIIEANARAEARQWSGPRAEILLQAADAIRELLEPVSRLVAEAEAHEARVKAAAQRPLPELDPGHWYGGTWWERGEDGPAGGDWGEK